MSFNHPRFQLAILCALGLWGGSVPSAEAGLIPWAYDAIFGPPGSQRSYYRGGATYGANYGGACCGQTYGNAAYGYSGEPNYFAPLPAGLSGPSMAPSPCGPGGCGTSFYGPEPAGCCGQPGCGPQGCGPGGCASGQCGVANPEPSFGPIAPTPTPANELPRTYENNSAPSSPGFQPRGEGYVPMRDTNTESPEEFKDPVPAPSTNPSRTPAPVDPLGEDDAGIRRGPMLDLDGKVTWRATPARTRLVLRANYSGAKVQRQPVYPKTDWVTYPGATDVARK